MFNNIKVLINQGKQYIPDIRNAKVPGIFRGRPVISDEKINNNEFIKTCPVNAILENENLEINLDLGKCLFCGECSKRFPQKIKFTTDYKLSANRREDLIIKQGADSPIIMHTPSIRSEVRMLKHSLKLRQVSAAGDNSTEWELNACNNVNFDMSRFGIEFVASPRHSDGIVITGPISNNMSNALEICFEAVPSLKVIILAGTDAISGGLFVDSQEINRSFIDNHYIDLYISGNPVHPLTFINGVLDFLQQ